MKDVDNYISKFPADAGMLQRLRDVMLSAGLVETIKWGMPVYVHQGTNVAGIASFKSYVGIWFFNGAALDDPYKVLVNAQEGKTVSQRQWRFSRDQELPLRKVREYISQAILAGAAPKPKGAQKILTIPEELQLAFKSRKLAAERFNLMSPSHQREYCEYVSEAKKPDTRHRRAEKVIGLILGGMGDKDQGGEST